MEQPSNGVLSSPPTVKREDELLLDGKENINQKCDHNQSRQLSSSTKSTYPLPGTNCINNNNNNNNKQLPQITSGDKQQRGKLGAVRSLDCSNGVPKDSNATSKPQNDTSTATDSNFSKQQRQVSAKQAASGVQQQQQQQQRPSMQMFNLKQLALNSRNSKAFKKRGSTTPGSAATSATRAACTLSRLLELSGSSSSGSGGAGNQQNDDQQQHRRRQSDGRPSDNQSVTAAGRRLSDGYSPAKSATEPNSPDQQLDDGEDFTEDCEYEEDDDDDDVDEDAEDEDDLDEDDEEDEAENERRVSCGCACERVISRIDYDGLPVTDVDLATYKDLCQLEQAQHMRINKRRQQQRHLLEPNSIAAVRSTLDLPGGAGLAHNSLRRSSLQEESGAYYQLCTSQEEQTIRQRYVWFPPSLKHLELVDQFFAQFPKEKIPFASARPVQSNPALPVASQASNSGANAGNSSQAPPLAGSYRDEQISIQLPRQDISLDYCSYPMSELNRQAYSQFVDKRNGQALDVGYVVQVSALMINKQIASIDSQNNEHQTTASSSKQRKTSLIPPVNQPQIQAQPPVKTQLQRCRRCLVRFEDKQLAVVAPNFIIGSSVLYNQRRPAESRPLSPPLPLRSVNIPVAHHQTEQPLANTAHFHPTCFTCSTCKEFLVDLVYCLRDNKLYCLRHYGESLRPRCNWCQELIFSDEYLKAMNESFHVDHFLCRHCDSNLAGQRYVLKEEKPFCIQCYEGNFANTCEDCQKPIGIDSRDLSYKDRHWHDTCFLCNKCQQSLIDKPFGSKADKVYCADCYDVAFAARCDGCKNPFRAGSKKMEYRGRQWHDSCFCCCICQNTIGSNSFIPKNDEIYCIKCYEDKYATRCTKCKQVIVSGGVTFRNEPWHRDCFNCCNCNKSLAGQRFTTRDVANETVKNTNKTNQPHNAYCIDCYGELFAKKCYACTRAITGLGGTRFVSFEDRSWHNDCFICNDCQTSLVGKGFITDGPDTILCGECARAKLR